MFEIWGEFDWVLETIWGVWMTLEKCPIWVIRNLDSNLSSARREGEILHTAASSPTPKFQSLMWWQVFLPSFLPSLLPPFFLSSFLFFLLLQTGSCHPSTSISHVLGLQICTTIPRCSFKLFPVYPDVEGIV
jgi:hypothetical protein